MKHINEYISISKSYCLICCLLLSASLAHAGGNIRPKISGPNDLYVNSYNGVLFFQRTDFATSNSIMPMELTFFYNSSARKANKGFGLGFSVNHGTYLEIDSDGSVTITSGDGHTDYYTRYGNNYQAPAGVFSTLTQPKPSQYLLVEKTGERYEFADTVYHHLTAQEDRFGNRTQYIWTDSLLTQIIDAVGHTITLSYTNGMLSKAEASFAPGAYHYSYDNANRLHSVTAPDGSVILYGYDKRNLLCRVTNQVGDVTTIVYNNSNMVSRMKTDVSDKSIRYEKDKTIFIDYTEPKNQYSYYQWDSKGRVIVKRGLCCGIQARIEYDENDNVIAHTDANGNTTHITYDDLGNALTITDPLGYTETYTYTADFNQPATYTDKNGNKYIFTYDDKGSLIASQAPLNVRTSYAYDSHGWLIASTDSKGNSTRITYNTDGTIASTTDALGNTSRFEYDDYGNTTTFTDALNNKTRYAYDQMNRLTTQTDALGYVGTISYNKAGGIVRLRDAKNHITAFTYDALGRVLTITNAKGNVSSFTYDGKDNVLTTTDPLGIVNTFTYNELNKLLSQTNGEGETISYDYDSKGNLTATMQTNGNVITYTYDALDRVVQIADNIGTIATYTYDRNGNQITATDAMGHTVVSTYDALNRLISRTMPTGAVTQYVYDTNSNLTAVEDALHHINTYTYDALNRQISHTNPLNAVTYLEYNANGNTIKATDANGNSTQYSYDALGNNTVITFANGQSLQYTYDELGQIIVSKDRAGRTFKYTYDILGNLLSKTYPDATTDCYTYDADGRMLTATNKNATVAYTYDRVGRLLSETLNEKKVSYAYDVAGGSRTITYPNGMTVDEQFNARGLIESIMSNGVETVTMAYNATGQKSSRTYNNGITTQYDYNDNGWLESIQADNGVMNLSYTYDAVGNITQRKDLLDDSRTETYTYDAIYQLTAFARGGNTVTYEYDQLGNRLKKAFNGMAINYQSDNVNAYTAISGSAIDDYSLSYDSNGNLTADNKHTYTYDYANRLVSIDNDSTNIYKYDALGRRIAKGKTLFVYSGSQMIEETTDGVVTSHLYGDNIDETLLMQRGENIWYYHANHLGSVIALTDTSGQVVERVDYDVFGMPSFFDSEGNSMPQSAVGNTILFTGREYDYASETYYFRARSLHPALGRFMQHDPLMYINGMNDYNYVSNKPINYVDNSGTSQDDCLGWKDFVGGAFKFVKGVLDLSKWGTEDLGLRNKEIAKGLIEQAKAMERLLKNDYINAAKSYEKSAANYAKWADKFDKWGKPLAKIDNGLKLYTGAKENYYLWNKVLKGEYLTSSDYKSGIKTAVVLSASIFFTKVTTAFSFGRLIGSGINRASNWVGNYFWGEDAIYKFITGPIVDAFYPIPDKGEPSFYFEQMTEEKKNDVIVGSSIDLALESLRRGGVVGVAR